MLGRLTAVQTVSRAGAGAQHTTRRPLHEADRQEYLELARDAVFSVMCTLEESPWQNADPTGERALAAAAKIRRNLNLLWLDGKLSEAEAERLLVTIRETLRAGLFDQDRLLRLTA